MDDRAAFLRAITEQPADHTARLVFADFLDETGAAADAVWAEFIRTQVEAETVHPNSNRAAEVERRARELFAAHWLDWWAPVCAAVGLPAPYRPASGVRGWLARRLSASGARPGHPYTGPHPRERLGLEVVSYQPPPLDQLRTVRFGGGFPEALKFLGQPAGFAEALRRWPDAAPLARLELSGLVARDWRFINGPHLSGIHTLELKHGSSNLLDALGRSPHLPHLETLRLTPDRSNINWGAEQYRVLAASPLAARVKRLSVEVAGDAETRALADSSFPNLTQLEIRSPRSTGVWTTEAAVVSGVLDLARSVRPGALEELALDATATAAVWRPAWPQWPGLRQLELFLPEAFAARPFPTESRFPALRDLALELRGNPGWVDALATWPGVVRLRHLRLDGKLAPTQEAVRTVLRLARALDADHLETLRVGSRVCNTESVRPVLVERFGARVRFG
jgi:uncharacterized protein (TIGR02996 family)